LKKKIKKNLFPNFFCCYICFYKTRKWSKWFAICVIWCGKTLQRRPLCKT